MQLHPKRKQIDRLTQVNHKQGPFKPVEIVPSTSKVLTNQHGFYFQGWLQHFVKADLTSVAPYVVLALLWVACSEKVPR